MTNSIEEDGFISFSETLFPELSAEGFNEAAGSSSSVTISFEALWSHNCRTLHGASVAARLF